MQINVVHKKNRSCVTCMHWDSPLRKFDPARQNVMFIGNNMARCQAPGDFEGRSTGATFKCRNWQTVRRMKPVPAEFVEPFKRWEAEEEAKREKADKEAKKPKEPKEEK